MLFGASMKSNIKGQAISRVRDGALAVLIAAGVVTPVVAVPAVTTAALQGRVEHVEDGDTVWLKADGQERIKIRLASIDAPEVGHTRREKGRVAQPYGDAAQRLLEALVRGRSVQLDCPDYDSRFKRPVCTIMLDGTSINAEMVRRGLAWANTSAKGRYLRDRTLLDLQRQAQIQGLGLWAGAHPIAPWQWRNDCWKEGVCPR